MRSLVAVVSFAAVLLLVVACGDGDDAPDTPGHAETTPTAEVDGIGFPFATETFVNDSKQAASVLHIQGETLALPSPPPSLVRNAAGCDQPTILHPVPDAVDVVWPDPCVEPGESVTIEFSADCPLCEPPTISSFEWASD